MHITSPELFRLQHSFIESKSVILENWITYDLPREILQNHNIEPELFIEKYASGVFDYFMGVISGDTEIGNCPVMQELLTYLKVREITADELFEICSHFRRAMIDFSYDANLNSKKLFDEISYVFDQNFRGILKFYTDTIFNKLIDARAEALRASQAKEYFLSNMSHEIRTPLNAILGFVNLLIDEDISHKHRGYLETILTSGESLLSIINDILDFSKLRSGEFTIEAKLFSLHDELTNTMELFVASASSKNITIVSFIDPNIPKELFGDPLRIKQIVSNLLSNAVKFTPMNGIVSVKAKYSTHSDMLQISIRDNGVGISQEDQKGIFSAFTQSQDNKLGASNGTGLGLSISRQLAQHMNGDIYLTSQINKGSTFYLELPIEVKNTQSSTIENIDELQNKQIVFYFTNEKNRFKLESLLIYFNFFKINIDVVNSLNCEYDVAIFIDEDIPEDWLSNHYKIHNRYYISLMNTQSDKYDQYDDIIPMTFPLYCSKIKNTFTQLLHPDTKSSYKKHSQIKFSGNILVAEDNEANQELIKILLKKYGLSYDLASNGLDALNLYKLGKYDLILMDEQMPIMDGNEAIKKILAYEKQEELQHTPIAALTANVIKGAREKGLKSGFDSFLGKPIIIKELEKVFSKYLQKNSSVPTKVLQEKKELIIGLDVNKLSEELMLTLDELSMLMKLFIKKMDKVLGELKVAIDKDEYKKISLLAHSVKGSSANFRIEILQNLSTEMEQNAKMKNSEYDYESTYKQMIEFMKGIEVK